MEEVDPIEELAESGEKQLQTLAESGNSLAKEWLEKIVAETEAILKLSHFGDMRVALMSDKRPEALAMVRAMFSHDEEESITWT